MTEDSDNDCLCTLLLGLSGGHPWLVNALAKEVVEERAPDTGTANAPCR